MNHFSYAVFIIRKKSEIILRTSTYFLRHLRAFHSGCNFINKEKTEDTNYVHSLGSNHHGKQKELLACQWIGDLAFTGSKSVTFAVFLVALSVLVCPAHLTFDCGHESLQLHYFLGKYTFIWSVKLSRCAWLVSYQNLVFEHPNNDFQSIVQEHAIILGISIPFCCSFSSFTPIPIRYDPLSRQQCYLSPLIKNLSVILTTFRHIHSL